jgi:hypothetical protein
MKYVVLKGGHYDAALCYVDMINDEVERLLKDITAKNVPEKIFDTISLSDSFCILNHDKGIGLFQVKACKLGFKFCGKTPFNRVDRERYLKQVIVFLAEYGTEIKMAYFKSSMRKGIRHFNEEARRKKVISENLVKKWELND